MQVQYSTFMDKNAKADKKTILIDAALYEQFFTFCKAHDKIVKAVTERLIREWLEKETSKEK